MAKKSILYLYLMNEVGQDIPLYINLFIICYDLEMFTVNVQDTY